MITSRNKPVALLTSIDGINLLNLLEKLRLSIRLRAIKSLDNIHKRSVSSGTDRLVRKKLRKR